MSSEQYGMNPLKPKGNRDTCARCHEKKGYNARRKSDGFGAQCRACMTAQQWAKNNKLFYDDPRVLEHADELYARYKGKEI